MAARIGRVVTGGASPIDKGRAAERGLVVDTRDATDSKWLGIEQFLSSRHGSPRIVGPATLRSLPGVENVENDRIERLLGHAVPEKIIDTDIKVLRR